MCSVPAQPITLCFLTMGTRKITNTPLKQGCHLFSHGEYSARGWVLLSQIPKKRLSFFGCSVLMGKVLGSSNLLPGERSTLNQNAVMELLIYLAGPTLGYKGTKDQDPYPKIYSVVGDGPGPSITATKGKLMLHKDAGSLPCMYGLALCQLDTSQCYLGKENSNWEH